jgi:hypothetical protein
MAGSTRTAQAMDSVGSRSSEIVPVVLFVVVPLSGSLQTRFEMRKADGTVTVSV